MATKTTETNEVEIEVTPEMRAAVISNLSLRDVAVLVASQFASVKAQITGEDLANEPTILKDIREDVVQLNSFGVEIGKLARELRDSFDEMVKLMHSLDVLSKDDVNVVHVPQAREGAGRKPMTPAERIAAAQKRLAKTKD